MISCAWRTVSTIIVSTIALPARIGGLDIALGSRMRLLSDEASFREAFSRFPNDDINGLSPDKLMRLGQEAQILQTYTDGTVTCRFDDGAQHDMPVEVLSTFGYSAAAETVQHNNGEWETLAKLELKAEEVVASQAGRELHGPPMTGEVSGEAKAPNGEAGVQPLAYDVRRGNQRDPLLTRIRKPLQDEHLPGSHFNILAHDELDCQVRRKKVLPVILSWVMKNKQGTFTYFHGAGATSGQGSEEKLHDEAVLNQTLPVLEFQWTNSPCTSSTLRAYWLANSLSVVSEMGHVLHDLLFPVWLMMWGVVGGLDQYAEILISQNLSTAGGTFRFGSNHGSCNLYFAVLGFALQTFATIRQTSCMHFSPI